MAGRLAGKLAVITGTGGGQGRAAALLFAQEGAVVVGGDVKADGAQETVDLVRANGGTMTSMHPLDFADPDAVRVWMDAAMDEHGRLDILYNNAAAPRFAPLMEMSIEDWHSNLRNELDLVFHVTRAAWPHLIANGGGSVISTGSIQGMSAMRPATGGFAHAAGKAGVIGMTRELAAEGGPHGIRVNAISPGLIFTEIVVEWADSMPGFGEAFVEAQLLDRKGQAEDIAHAALFLASDESAFVTGHNLVVDGGYTAV